MVEDGVAEMDDLLNDRIGVLEADRETAHAALERARGANRSPVVIPSDKVVAFGKYMLERLTTGEIPFRKAYLGAIIDRVEVDDHQIRTRGGKEAWNRLHLRKASPYPGFAVLFANGAAYGNRTRLCNVKGCRPNR